MKIKDFLDNGEELAIGAALGLSTVFIADLKALLIVLPCAIFWRLGGVTGGNKWFRRLGVSFSMVGVLFWATHSLWCLVPFCLLWAPLSLGYGLPDPPDEGSKLGAFFFKLTGGRMIVADIMTRGTIAFLCSLTLAPLVMSDLPGTLLMIGFILVSFPMLTVLIK